MKDAKTRAAILARCRVEDGGGFKLADYDPDDTGGLKLTKSAATALLRKGTARLDALQDRLFAQDRWAVLCIFQAMDAAGKDGAVKHVFTGVNPQGVRVASFKAPSGTELEHDFLWRHVQALPPRGEIGIHNRSWYEEVLVARVHPQVLAAQKLPGDLVGKRIWRERLEDIAAYERFLARQGTVILKFFLHLSAAEQRRRFLARIKEPEKNWKFRAADVTDREHWDDYQAAYQHAIRATAAPHAPWFVVPADHKWFTRLVVADALIQALEALDLHYPRLGEAEMAAFEAARQSLG